MTKSQLITVSGVRDFLDFILIGQIPGLNWLLDLPVLIMHLKYAGPVALFTLLEAFPIVGFFPIWTIAAMSYKNHDKPAQPEAPVVPQQFVYQQPAQYLPSPEPVRRVESRVVAEFDREES
jgi:hypothetical protein